MDDLDFVEHNGRVCCANCGEEYDKFICGFNCPYCGKIHWEDEE